LLPDPAALAVLRRHAKGVSALLERRLADRPLGLAIVKQLTRLWRRQLARQDSQAVGISLEELCLLLDRQPTREVKNSVSVQLNRVRVTLRDTPMDVPGWRFTFDVPQRRFRLDVTPIRDARAATRAFWASHLSHEVAVGVFSRLFFHIRTKQDDVYVRDALVNSKSSLRDQSLVGMLLRRHPDNSETYQYVSSGEVAGAFELMGTLAGLGVSVRGVRVDAGVPNNAIILGAGLSNQKVPWASTAGRLRIIPKGVSQPGKHFHDNFSAPEPLVHVLLSRWRDSERGYITSIYSGGSYAVEGVCHALCYEHSVATVLEIAPTWSEGEGQLLFRVTLSERGGQLRFDTVSVWNGRLFVQVLPR